MEIGYNKFFAAGVAMVVGVVVTWLANQGVTVPPEVSAGATGFLCSLLVWAIPHRGKRG